MKAARWILARGPKHVIIKKGEHGAFMFTEKTMFFAPAYPLEDVFDPTGAGDSFAGGFIGYLAAHGRPQRGEPASAPSSTGRRWDRSPSSNSRSSASSRSRATTSRARARVPSAGRLRGGAARRDASRIDYKRGGRRHRRRRRREGAAAGAGRIDVHGRRAGRFGGFGGMFRVPDGRRVTRCSSSSADGVGTKIKVAIEAGRHDTIGHDLVNHCVNDILVQGARPLFFLDYVAFGTLDPEVVEAVVRGVAAGCRENGCALLGGETAEMPGVYTPPDYDLAGFIVGYVDESRDPRCRARTRTAMCWSRSPAAGSTPTAIRSRGSSSPSACGFAPEDPFPGGSGYRRGRAARGASVVPAGARARARPRARDGAHHGRRTAGEREPCAAPTVSTPSSRRRAGECPTSFRCCNELVTCRATRCSGRSTWVWGWSSSPMRVPRMR